MTGITFDGAVIKFTEARIELYKIITVMSSLSQECITKERMQIRDITRLMELIAKAISSVSQG